MEVSENEAEALAGESLEGTEPAEARAEPGAGANARVNVSPGRPVSRQ
jgi:hypothetical protein